MSAATKPSTPALFVDEDSNLKVIHDVPVPELVEGEVVVKVLYSGVNPADVKHGSILGVRPTIIGYDFCGRVVKAATNSDFRAGDLVAGYTPTGVGRPLRYGVHQEHLSCPENMMFRVPENLPQTHAASLTTVLTTAADGLYNIFGLPLPGEKPNDGFRPGPLLIWGASASVGACMLQLARASGTSPIFVTASPARHELLKKLGATQCFDYRAPDVVSRIKAAAEESKAGPIAYAADCAGSLGEVSSVSQMEACVDDNAIILSVVVHPGKQYKLPLASAAAPVKFQLRNGPLLTFPARPEDWKRMWKALMWAVDKYGAEFELPAVDVFKGSAEDALEKVKMVAEQGKFGKLVLEQPMS
ncbi:trans-enoyl reductase fsr4 [Colletotrichum spaethianum]|uniref:Trans-enoyl reductase fsr4 n=1 Tax=Colletotrichum spaethianum TaxID=700344 RepID=A0AA37USL1_9PEZI|nr:trans-enoyl reductase fsr4 [Colletotrichum spaethianum]GKT50028.1 trans-enoyl reductase fsr4 [Colletotrichum spaethianum]